MNRPRQQFFRVITSSCHDAYKYQVSLFELLLVRGALTGTHTRHGFGDFGLRSIHFVGMTRRPVACCLLVAGCCITFLGAWKARSCTGNLAFKNRSLLTEFLYLDRPRRNTNNQWLTTSTVHHFYSTSTRKMMDRLWTEVKWLCDCYCVVLVSSKVEGCDGWWRDQDNQHQPK